MKYFLFLIMAFGAFYNTHAQNQQTLYQFDPQSNATAFQMNPAFIPAAKFTIGLPISQLNIQGRFGLKPTDIGTYDQETQTLNINANNYKIRSGEDFENRFSGNFTPIFIAYSNGKTAFSFSAGTRFYAQHQVSQSLIDLAINGNGFTEEELAGGQYTKVTTGNISTSNIVYGQASMGFGRKIGERLTIGLKGSFLWGMYNVSTNDMSVTIESDARANRNKVHSSDGVINTSNISDNSAHGDEILSAISPNGNYGVAIDLGINYQLTEKVTISAVVKDMGAIQWDQQTEEITFSKSAIDQNGIDLDRFLNIKSESDGSDVDFLEEVTDQFEEVLQLDSVQNKKHTATLPIRNMISIDYQLSKRHRVGLTSINEFHQGSWNAGISTFYNFYLGSAFSMIVNWTAINNSYDNIGAGFRWNIGAVQLYMLTDNILAPLRPHQTNNFALSTGINLQFGRKKMKVKNWED
ncbi:DUF5723 family protein [Persicobacter psychrovividus]|uniref:DUF5723 domain-containing protein n=1 Tax=Persicobacter psychrovividus TaxID=387638 RepID=A0ABM7VL64_9BACT|nr:hypothetical protein PEPS_39840 [Persicobacter psychrovividus]